MVQPSGSVAGEHHFVPQFYLRHFSTDGKRIGLYNFSHQRAILGASVKHQCSRHNFYGFAPELEMAFSALEGDTAAIIREVLSTKQIPSARWLPILCYMVFQKLRTTNAGYETDAIADYVAKTILQGDPQCRDLDLDSFVVRNRYPVALPLKQVDKVIPVASDLRGHLLINASRHEFVTSDDPVVTHNQYCEGIDYGGVNGWNCRGLQVFWPISPEALILAYDPLVYKVGSSHRGKHVSLITTESDVTQLNSLQILNASKNVYFRSGAFAPAIEEHCKSLIKRRPKGRVRFIESEAVSQEDGTQSALVHVSRPLLPLRLALSLIKVRTNARRIPHNERYALERHPLERSALSDTVGQEAVYPVRSVTVK